MRRAPALALLILAAALTGWGASQGSSRAASLAGTPSVSGRMAPSGFVVGRDISEPLCNGGRGDRFSGPFGNRQEEVVTVASATIAGGSTLIAFSSGYANKSFAVLDSFTPRCARDSGFGADGSATITIPASLRPAQPPANSPEGLSLDVLAARNGGGAIVAGSYGGDWVVGEVTGGGQLDPLFAQGGWSALPFEGEVTAVFEEPSGRIIIGGNEHASGCCTVNWAAALSPSGQLEQAFGKHGRAELPTGEDSGIQRLAAEPNGDILADVGHGNMGCWGSSLAMLTPSGEPEPDFAQRLQRFWRAQGFGAFIGDTYVEGEGFTLIGTGQKPCYDEPPGSTARATGLIAHFRIDGTPAGPTVRFPSQMYGTVQAFPDGHDAILAESPYADGADIALTALRPDGSTDPRFAARGQARIRAPGSSAAPRTVSITRASSTELVLVSTGFENNQVQLVAVRL